MQARLTLWTDLFELARRAAPRFGTPELIILEPLLPEHRPKKDGHASRTYGTTPTIGLRVHRYHRRRQTLAEGTIMATFAHELGHLAAWDEKPVHGPRWLAATRAIAAWIREQGYQVSSNLVTGTYPRKRKRKRGRR